MIFFVVVLHCTSISFLVVVVVERRGVTALRLDEYSGTANEANMVRHSSPPNTQRSVSW